MHRRLTSYQYLLLMSVAYGGQNSYYGLVKPASKGIPEKLCSQCEDKSGMYYVTITTGTQDVLLLSTMCTMKTISQQMTHDKH